MKVRTKAKAKSTSAGVRLEGTRIIVRDIRREDSQQMRAWRPFSDTLHILANIARTAPVSRGMWLALHGADRTSLLYVIERRSDGKVVGRVSLREIVGHSSARLGIACGADFVNQGYGSEALRVFLPYYFRTLGFQRLCLDVAATNKRAIHVYEKLRFRHAGSHYRDVPAHHDLSFLKQEEYRSLRMYFRRHFGRMQLLFHDMVLKRDEWEKQVSESR